MTTTKRTSSDGAEAVRGDIGGIAPFLPESHLPDLHVAVEPYPVGVLLAEAIDQPLKLPGRVKRAEGGCGNKK